MSKRSHDENYDIEAERSRPPQPSVESVAVERLKLIEQTIPNLNEENTTLMNECISLIGCMKETDKHRLSQRQKQIDIGKNTVEYKSYLESTPVSDRLPRNQYTTQPRTPDKTDVCSARAFEGRIRAWRRMLHGIYTKQRTGEFDEYEEEMRNAAIQAANEL